VGTQRPGEVASRAVSEPLQEYRESIDNIDAALVFLLAERFKITKKVGAYKAAAGLPASDPDREQQQIGRLRELAASAHLDPEFSEKFLRFIVEEVIRHHQRQAEAHESTD
jgi:chorismate mutase